MKNSHHYRVELYYIITNMQLEEFNNRFDKMDFELLHYAACLNSGDSFSIFNKEKLFCSILFE